MTTSTSLLSCLVICSMTSSEPDGDDRHARHRRVLGRRDGQRLDVVAARGEEARDARQRARLVLHEDREDVAHGRPRLDEPPRAHSSSARIISVRPLPPGTIGNTFSVWSVMKSRKTRRSFCANASRSAPSTSPGFSILMPDVAVRLGELHEVGQRVHVRLGVAVAVEELLPLPHHAHVAVVQVHDLDRQVVLLAGRELLDAHLDRRLAGHARDRRVRD